MQQTGQLSISLEPVGFYRSLSAANSDYLRRCTRGESRWRITLRWYRDEAKVVSVDHCVLGCCHFSILFPRASCLLGQRSEQKWLTDSKLYPKLTSRSRHRSWGCPSRGTSAVTGADTVVTLATFGARTSRDSVEIADTGGVKSTANVKSSWNRIGREWKPQDWGGIVSDNFINYMTERDCNWSTCRDWSPWPWHCSLCFVCQVDWLHLSTMYLQVN